jgi:titin
VNFTFLANVGANVRAYTHSGLAASTKVYYRVQALGSSANSGYSNVANATTAGVGNPAGVPAAPTNLAAAISTSVAHAVNLSWRDNATNESGYKIERSTDGRTFYPLAGTGANGTFNRNTGLTAGKRYYYRVFAWNGVGTSGMSNVVSVVVPVAAAPVARAGPFAWPRVEEREERVFE